MEEIKNKLVGTFINSKSFGFVVPDDKKIGTDIFINKCNINYISNGSIKRGCWDVFNNNRIIIK